MELNLKSERLQKLWKEIVKRLSGIGKKDYVLHTKSVVLAMQGILEKEEVENEEIMLAAAMLHDSGWSKVPEENRFPKTDEEKKVSEELHIRYAKDVIDEVCPVLGFTAVEIAEITRIVQSHKSKEPNGDITVACIVDADNLSDTFQDSFYSDVKSYHSVPMKTYEFRLTNKYFTKSAEEVAKAQLADRLKEIESGEAEKLMK